MWALSEASKAEALRQHWVADYLQAFPHAASRVEAFVSPPGPAAREI